MAILQCMYMKLVEGHFFMLSKISNQGEIVIKIFFPGLRFVVSLQVVSSV